MPEQKMYRESWESEQATERAIRTMQERTKKETEVRDYLIERVLDEIPYTRLNGHPTKTTSEQRKLQLPVHRRRVTSDHDWI